MKIVISDPASEESFNNHMELIKSFREIYEKNCNTNKKTLTSSQNTAIFLSGSLTRLIYPPRTHHADNVKRISREMYVQIKIKI